jgi:hypothetical protein
MNPDPQLFFSFVDPDPYFFNCTQDFLEAYILYVVKWRFSTTWALGATFLVYCQKITKLWRLLIVFNFKWHPDLQS